MHRCPQIVSHLSATFSFLLTLIFLISPQAIFGQVGGASISGRVSDPSGAVVQNAELSIKNVDTNVTAITTTNRDGLYAFPSLTPGNYVLSVHKRGFRSEDLVGLTLYTQDELQRNFALDIGSVSESVTVTAGTTNVSPAVSLTVTREFIENMPLNGRSFQDLIQLAPGAVSNQHGYYSINGQRTDTNNYTVDGASANLGGYNNGGPGSGLAGASPSQTVVGTTQSLASIDSLQEFKIQTSGYAAEYGRTPGGQVEFTTRSGTNDIHGTLFEYLRNTVFDANSYNNDYFGYPKTGEHQNDFGGTVGGPLVIPRLYNGEDKTFYFFSYEGLRLLLPSFESEYVPTQGFRDWASPYVRPYLNTSPLPNPNSPGNQDGCTVPDPTTGELGACDALFTYGFSTPNNLDNISVRVDQNLSKPLHAFIRYSDTPSSLINGAEAYQIQTINTHTWTAGLTASIKSTLINDVRFNYSHDGEENAYGLKALGGSVPVPRNLLIPAAYDSAYAYGQYFLGVPGTSLNQIYYFGGYNTTQHQYQLLDYLAWTRGDHGVKFGIDWRRLAPTYTPTPYSSGVSFGSLSDIQQGYASTVYASAISPGKPIFDNLSVYVQDHWRIGPKLSLDYGVRWEFNPPPGPSNGDYPATLTSTNLATAEIAPMGTSPYKATYTRFAPRFGFAWNAVPSGKHPLAVRAGFGLFYDTGQSAVGNAYAGNAPFAASGPTLTEVPLPLSAAVLAPPVLGIPLAPPYPVLIGISSPELTLPYTEQWNLSVDETINSRNTVTVSYLGNNGRGLLFTQAYYASPQGNPDFPNGLYYTDNGSQSSYNALQVQDTGRIMSGLDLIASFTLAHALDNASDESSQFAPIYGNSDNDVRRVLNLALNYQTATVGSRRWMQALTHGWEFANRFSTQSGYPLNILQSYVTLSSGASARYGPDFVSGVPLYLHGRNADINGQTVPGSWRLNPAAFAAVPTDANGIPVRQGTLGRNFIRNPSFYALNTGLQRSFPIYEQLHVNFRVEAFNIFNHPNLSFPDVFSGLTSSTFGQLVFGDVTTIGSSNSLYAMGAARSLQLSLRVQF